MWFMPAAYDRRIQGFSLDRTSAAKQTVVLVPDPMKSTSAAPPPSPLEQAARPLLQLVQNISGVESTFVTSIDWDAQSQTIRFANNQGALDVVEGVALDWRDSMCGSLRLSGVAQSCSVGIEVAATPWAVANGIQTFFAAPILVDEITIGTVCGASQDRIVLDETQLDGIRLIAQALQRLLVADRDTSNAHARADAAELEAVEARNATKRQAIHSQHMERLAYTDALTGLPNRRAFMARWESELARSAREDYAIGLILLDADRFKAVNDSDGHAMGDAVLRAISATLLVVARPPDLVARLGGDEFALLSTHTSSAHLEDLADRIGTQFHVVAAELGVDTTLSLGMVSSEHCPRERMLADADQALYRSKDAGGNASRMFLCDGSAAELPRVCGPTTRVNRSAST
jgi:diguanylate cyclase